MSTSFEARKGRELLKPPELKPAVTIFLMLICALNTGKGDINWLFSHSLSGQSIALALAATPTPTTVNTATPHPAASKSPAGAPPPPQAGGGGIVYFLTELSSFRIPKLAGIFPNNGIVSVIELAWNAAIGQITIWIMLVNVLFIFLFGNILEKKLIQWRYWAFIATAVLGPALIIYFTAPIGSPDYLQKVVGPTLMTCFFLGGYLCFMPKKPWKPAEWKPPRWKVFKGNDEQQRNLVKVPWVNPWTYVVGFAMWTGLQQACFTFGRSDVVTFTHQVMAGNVYSAITGGTVSGGTIAIITLLPGILSVVAGAVFSQIYLYTATTVRYKRQSSDLQVQAVLQYKELRALDMNHNQAVEGTSKLIGVPLDICRDWINKGLQPIKDD